MEAFQPMTVQLSFESCTAIGWRACHINGQFPGVEINALLIEDLYSGIGKYGLKLNSILWLFTWLLYNIFHSVSRIGWKKQCGKILIFISIHIWYTNCLFLVTRCFSRGTNEFNLLMNRSNPFHWIKWHCGSVSVEGIGYFNFSQCFSV